MLPPIAALSARSPGGAARLAVLIVDDSVVARMMIARMIEKDARFAVVGAVSDTRAALHFLGKTHVDAIVLDVEMPGVDGLTALPDLLVASDGAKVLVVSGTRGSDAALIDQALAVGASDTLVKPAIGAFAGLFSTTLIDRLARMLAADRTPVSTERAPVGEPSFDIVAIGASTGGIHALGQVLREIPGDFTVPILITQHLPEAFMPYFAAQVAVLARRPCEVASDHMRIRPGCVIVAPGDAHMRIVRLADGAAIRLTRAPAVSGCMPSVDPMFEALADVYGARALAVVLSGMGRDGSIGARSVAAAGGSVVVQDRASSVVWGMPGAIDSAGGADATLPPDAIGRLIAGGRRPGC